MFCRGSNHVTYRCDSEVGARDIATLQLLIVYGKTPPLQVQIYTKSDLRHQNTLSSHLRIRRASVDKVGDPRVCARVVVACTEEATTVKTPVK